MFNIQSYTTQEYRSPSDPISIPEAKSTHAWPFRPRTNRFPVTQADRPFFASAGRRVFAPVRDDPRHKNRSGAWAVARGLLFWAVQSWALVCFTPTELTAKREFEFPGLTSCMRLVALGSAIPPCLFEDVSVLREACYETARTASTICLAEMPKASRSSSGSPECGISRTARSCDLAGATPACARADRTASPIPPSAQ